MIDLAAIGRKGEGLFGGKSYVSCNHAGNGVAWIDGDPRDMCYRGTGHIGDFTLEFGLLFNYPITHDVALKLAELADYIQLLQESEDENNDVD